MAIKENVLVIGANSFIGRAITKKCIQNNWNVFCCSKKKVNKFSNNKKYNFIKFDSEKKKLSKKINKNYKYVFYCAGKINHSKRKGIFGKLFNSHFLNLCQLVSLLQKKVEKFIYFSSADEYGKVKSPLKETSNIQPLTNYAKIKSLAVQYLITMYKLKKINSTVFRVFLSYGPDQNFDRLIPYVIKNSFLKKKIHLTSCNQFKDFIYIDDLIELVFRSIKKKNSAGKIYNAASGKKVKLKKIIEIIRKKTNNSSKNIIYGTKKIRKNESINQYADISLIKKHLNWKPKISLKKGLDITIKSYLSKISR